MADIELVIKIPEGAYQLLKNEGVDWLGAEHILNAVANGTLLPKGHGKLIDINELITKLEAWDYKANGIPNYAWNCIKDAQAIIEADKAESEDVE